MKNDVCHLTMVYISHMALEFFSFSLFLSGLHRFHIILFWKLIRQQTTTYTRSYNNKNKSFYICTPHSKTSYLNSVFFSIDLKFVVFILFSHVNMKANQFQLGVYDFECSLKRKIETFCEFFFCCKMKFQESFL